MVMQIDSKWSFVTVHQSWGRYKAYCTKHVGTLMERKRDNKFIRNFTILVWGTEVLAERIIGSTKSSNKSREQKQRSNYYYRFTSSWWLSQVGLCRKNVLSLKFASNSSFFVGHHGHKCKKSCLERTLL